MPVFFLIFIFFLFLALSFYLPALHGPFVLDDEPNFYGLRFIHDAQSALAYSYNGPAGTRWISYLTFTMPSEITAWENADAFAFKLINLIIHGINSVLVFASLIKLSNQTKITIDHPILWSLGISVIWAILPIHAGTVLYSVQRMTLLSGTVVLAGIYYHLAFLAKHNQAINDQTWLGYTLTLWIITVLGILCKESAILLPLYIFVLYAFTSPRIFSRLQIIVSFLLPYLLLIAYLTIQHKLNYSGRNFTLYERLLSEVVILKNYVFDIIKPSFNSFSLFHDDFIPVRGISDPRFTKSILFWLMFISLAKLGNKAVPGLWFGCLWFLAGHSLESTIIPLELYFEHRNYLPALGLLVMAAALFHATFNWIQTKSISVLLAILIVAISARYLLVLQQETKHWMNDDTLSKALIEKHPFSIRANQFYIENLVRKGKYSEAIIIIEHIHEHFGISASNAIFQIGLSCLNQPEAEINHPALINDLKTLPKDMSVSNAMEFLLQLTTEKACPSLTWNIFEQYTASLLANPKQRIHYHNLVFLLVSSHVQRKDFISALKSSYQLQKELYSPQFIFLQMHLSLTTKNLPSAEAIYNEINAFDTTQKILYKDEIENIHLALEQLKNARKN